MAIKCQHLIPALNAQQPGQYNTQPHTWLPPSFLGMDAYITSQLNVALICKLHGPLMCLAHVFDMLSIHVIHPWVFVQPGTGRPPVDWPVQEYNVCTGPYCSIEQHSFNHTGDTKYSFFSTGQLIVYHNKIFFVLSLWQKKYLENIWRKTVHHNSIYNTPLNICEFMLHSKVIFKRLKGQDDTSQVDLQTWI